MKRELNWLYVITYITVICLMVVVGVCCGKIKLLEDRVKQLEDKTTSIELRVEDIMPNDDLLAN